MIELVDLRLDHPRGGPPLVAGANLRVEPGQLALVVAGAGAGATRLLDAVLGEAPAAAGQVRLFGHEPARLRRGSLRRLRRRVGVVPQGLALVERATAEANVLLPLEIDGVARAEAVARATLALTRVGLQGQAGVPVERLSAAARQRVALARALIRAPELIVADHPTSAQDDEGAALVGAVLAQELARGAAALVVTRDPALRAVADLRGWRRLALEAGALRPAAAAAELPDAVAETVAALGALGAVAVHDMPPAAPDRGIVSGDITVDSTAVPARHADDAAVATVIPFPLTARLGMR